MSKSTVYFTGDKVYVISHRMVGQVLEVDLETDPETILVDIGTGRRAVPITCCPKDLERISI